MSMEDRTLRLSLKTVWAATISADRSNSGGGLKNSGRNPAEAAASICLRRPADVYHLD
jgi:hypothetical protein